VSERQRAIGRPIPDTDLFLPSRMLAHSGSTLNDAPLSRSVSNTKIVEEPAQPNFRRQRSQFGRTEEVEESITAPGTIGSRPSTKGEEKASPRPRARS
jgi:hypothetical protein